MQKKYDAKSVIWSPFRSIFGRNYQNRSMNKTKWNPEGRAEFYHRTETDIFMNIKRINKLW